MLNGALRRHEIVELMLGEESHLQPRSDPHLAGFRIEASGDELRKGRFAVAVRTEQSDPVVRIDAQIEPLQMGLPGSYPTAPP